MGRIGELQAADAAVPRVVEAVAGDARGGLRLALSGGRALEAFPNATPTGHVATEFRRLLRPAGGEPHLVAGTSGVERERGA